ncbi:MAG: hypothetical protein ONB48_18100 [candidate division KSB1 bacterium]|nr:hypothetical protein [candidate division KSB1 bacterium]MDZ7275806.1 hypothetical protein [candidate division KSB1 bacterium]MDZ7287557.1 hypothetical protein [candidate division KSB1 bacterium]MDZ7308039.1 hypothetical protein [candidate division KSB1 bacterium]MDZ7350535.1 hypothetical protein [candidate division KSB1 bacterium]
MSFRLKCCCCVIVVSNSQTSPASALPGLWFACPGLVLPRRNFNAGSGGLSILRELPLSPPENIQDFFLQDNEQWCEQCQPRSLRPHFLVLSWDRHAPEQAR